MVFSTQAERLRTRPARRAAKEARLAARQLSLERDQALDRDDPNWCGSSVGILITPNSWDPPNSWEVSETSSVGDESIPLYCRPLEDTVSPRAKYTSAEKLAVVAQMQQPGASLKEINAARKASGHTILRLQQIKQWSASQEELGARPPDGSHVAGQGRKRTFNDAITRAATDRIEKLRSASDVTLDNIRMILEDESDIAVTIVSAKTFCRNHKVKYKTTFKLRRSSSK